MLANQSVPLIREGDKYFRLECRVTANPSITVQWTKETFSYRAKGPSAEGSSTSSKEASHNFKERPSIDWSRSNLSQSLVPNLSARPDTGAHTVVSVLLVHEVSYVDAGLYTCVTPNDTKQIQVPIEHYPRIMSGINARKVAADGATPSVKFVCSAVAYPISHFNWTVNGNGMVSGASSVNGRPSGVSDKYSVTSRHGLGTHGSSTSNSEMSSYHFTSELIIRDVNEADFGQYECIAFNQMGTDRATFELVQKSKLMPLAGRSLPRRCQFTLIASHSGFPESPFNLRAINVTHNSAFLIWDTGFDYGHEQTFQLRLWQLDSELLGQLEKTAESEHSQLLVSRLSRTLANLSVPHCPVGNLEPNIYYRIAVFASNRMGDSLKSAYLTIHTSAVPSYPLKPVYASADEQRLNGLIGNTIIVGEDFLEISVILCLILLLVVSLSTSTFIYCRRRSNRRHQEKALSSSSASSDQTHSFDEPRRSTCEESPFGHSHNPTDCVGPDNLPTASSTLSNQLTMPGLCSEHTGNSLSTTSSYLVKDDYASSYCRTLGLLPTSNFDCQCKWLHTVPSACPSLRIASRQYISSCRRR